MQLVSLKKIDPAYRWQKLLDRMGTDEPINLRTAKGYKEMAIVGGIVAALNTEPLAVSLIVGLLGADLGVSTLSGLSYAGITYLRIVNNIYEGKIFGSVKNYSTKGASKLLDTFRQKSRAFHRNFYAMVD